MKDTNIQNDTQAASADFKKTKADGVIGIPFENLQIRISPVT